jgi:NADPH:quinone reductase
VVKAGEGVRRYKPGDLVCALVPGGGYAEFAVVAETNALPIPAGLSMVEAGAIPETYFTVWTNVFERGRLQPGETLLVHGGSSGIGTTAIQLAKALGSKVIVTAGSDEKCKACRDLGADQVRDNPPDVILDMVGGPYIARDLKALAANGRLVIIAFQQGSVVEADLLPVMLKRLTITGSTLRPRTISEKAAIALALEKNVWPLLAQGQCKPVIYKTFPLEEAAAAHALMESSEHIGKIVLVA